MKALVLKEKNSPLVYEEFNQNRNDNDILVNIKAAALNHRDVWITKGMYPGITYPAILGSDGAGFLGGQEVIINPSLNWGDNEKVQANDYQILGLPSHGTFAEKISIHKEKVFPKPKHLNMEEAAALPLSGLTAYRALFTKGKLQKGEKVLISGVGGGVALFACQFAIAAGAKVYVTSGSEEKIEKAKTLGAIDGANYKDENWAKTLVKETGGFDLIIDSAGGDGFKNLLKVAAPGARITMYGGTRGLINGISPQLLFWKQISLFGTTMGSDKEFTDMVKFVEEHKIIPVIDSVFKIEDANAAFDRMDKGLQFGKIILKT